MNTNITVNNDLFLLKDLIELFNQEEIKTGGPVDIHQFILDVGYEWWQNQTGAYYSDMIRYMVKTYGVFAGLMILVGKLNQQVCNGGWLQYYDNDYAGGSSINNYKKIFDHPLHNSIIASLEQYEFLILKLSEEDQRLITMFIECCKTFNDLEIDTDEKIEDEEYDEETGETYYEMIDNPGYGEFVNKPKLQRLDTEYYEFNDELMMVWERLVQLAFVYSKLATDTIDTEN